MKTNTAYFVKCDVQGQYTTTAREFMDYIAESKEEYETLKWLESIIREEYQTNIDELEYKFQKYVRKLKEQEK